MDDYEVESVSVLTDSRFRNKSSLESAISEVVKLCRENRWLKERIKPLNTRDLCRKVSLIYSKYFYTSCITGFRVNNRVLTFIVMSRDSLNINNFALCEVEE